MASKKVQKKTVRKKKTTSKSSIRLKSEVSGLILVAFAILLGLSIFSDNAAGPLGEILARFAGGLFGLSGFAIPFLILIHGLFKIFRPRFVYEDKRFSLILILLILFSAMFQAGLHDISYYENMTLDRYIKVFYQEGKAALGKSDAFLPSGGILGGIIGVPLLMVFRKWGTMLILITLAVIDAMLITKFSIAEAARNVAKGTTEAINGVVGAAKKKIEERNMQRAILIDSTDGDSTESTGKKKAKIIDFRLQKKLSEPVNSEENFEDSVQNDDFNYQGNTGNEPQLTLLTPHNNGDVQDVNEVQDIHPVKVRSKKKVEVNAEIGESTLGQSDAESSPGIAGDNLAVTNQTDAAHPDAPKLSYTYPPVELLSRSKESETNIKRIEANASVNAKKLEETLASFGIGAKVINVSVGPAFTRFELQPAPGVKVSRIVNLTDDIALNLASTGIRIEAPIPGKAAIGIEVPNKKVAPISLRSVLESREFKEHPSKLAVALGKDISGENMVIDLAKMPHVLIAGATGSGKSVFINSIVISLLYKSSPDEVKLLMVDPKVVELGVYNGIPHLLIPVVTDPNKAAGALRWAVTEMTTRYKLFADRGVRDLLGYNAVVEETGEGEKLPQIVIIIDELADLMMVAPHDVEDSICRLAQMARAAGMHLVIATQRPSVNVITGVIKANIPSRISFAVSSQVDSRTILDMAGAEKLLGKGDMLYYPVGVPKPVRVKGTFVSDKEVELVVDFVKNQLRARYDEEIIENINENINNEKDNSLSDDTDDLLEQAIDAVIDCGQASVSFIQRKFKVGYARAGRIIDQMAERNIISGYEGSKPRRVLISREQWEEMKLSNPGE